MVKWLNHHEKRSIVGVPQGSVISTCRSNTYFHVLKSVITNVINVSSALQIMSPTEECRASTGECDVPEFCDGSSAQVTRIACQLD